MLQFISESTILHHRMHEYLFVLNPINWANLLVEINEYGLWSIFGATFTGGILWFIWFLEAAIIIAIPLGLNKETNVVFYSKLLNKKYPQFILNKDFKPMFYSEEFKNKLKENCLKTIENLSFG